jgi:hypothetical protein
MKASDPTIRLLVGATLPVSATFGRENFAGDPVVREFFDRARKTLNIDPEIFVSWSCPPDVFIIKSSTANILVRSERFDTLLVEYFHLRYFAKTERSSGVLDEVYNTSILRWMFEFFLGNGDVSYALYAISKAHENYRTRLEKIPFRPLSLASLPEIQRAAMQCFCLAHEMAHLVQDKVSDPSLFSEIDGLRLVDHLNRELEAARLTQDRKDKMLRSALANIDAANLLQEIDADLIAVELVSVFLATHFAASFEDAIYATLDAFEAQCFMYAMKHSCSLFRNYGGDSNQYGALLLDDWLGATQTALRARCATRRAGIIWAQYAEPNEKFSAEKVNRYVPRVDAMIVDHDEFLEDTSRLVHSQLISLFEELPPAQSDQDKALFIALIDKVRSSEKIKMDICHAMIAMGFSSATDVVRYFEKAFDVRYAGR